MMSDNFNNDDLKKIVHEVLASSEAECMTVTEMRKYIRQRNDLPDQVLQLSPSRKGEMKIDQLVRNFVSHQSDNTVEYYKEGFILDKTSKPALFYLSYPNVKGK